MIDRDIQVNNGIVQVASSQDVEAVLDEAKARHNAGLHGSNEMRHAAQLPYIIIEAYCNDKGITFDEWMANSAHVNAMLNDPSLSHFRVWKGRV